MLIEAGNVLSDRLTKARWMDDVSTTYKQAAFTNRSALSFTGHFDDAFLRQASFKFIQRLPFAGSVSYRRSTGVLPRDKCSLWLKLSVLFSLNAICGWVVDQSEVGGKPRGTVKRGQNRVPSRSHNYGHYRQETEALNYTL